MQVSLFLQHTHMNCILESLGMESSPVPPKRNRNKSEVHHGIDDHSRSDDDDSESKDRALELRETLLQLIKASAQTEIKVFASTSTEANEEDENVDLRETSNFQTLSSYPEAICELVTMFDKLRRFPKLIAKLLRCFRKYIFNEGDFDPNWKEVDMIELFLPHEFMKRIGPICATLPAGQMMEDRKSVV